MALLRSLPSTIFLLGLLGAGIWSALTIRFETELLPVLPQSLPSIRGIAEFQRLAAGEDEVYVVADPALPTEDRQRLVSKARDSLRSSPAVGSVTVPSEELVENAGVFAAWMASHANSEVFARISRAMSLDEANARLAEVPSRLKGAVDPLEVVRLQIDPLGLLPGDAPLAGGGGDFLIVRPSQPLVDTASDSGFVDAVRESLPDRTHLLLTGRPVFNTDISRQMRSDIFVMVGAAVVLLAAAFLLFYRTLRPLGWIMLLQFFALLAGVVAARLLFGSLNVLSIGFASILLGVGMDYSILVYHHFGSPHGRDAGAWRTLRRAIWFSALVTASAFYFLAFTSFPALRELGVLVGTGLLASALLATWQLRLVLAANPPDSPPALLHASRSAASFVGRHRGLLTGIGVALLVSLIWLRPWSQAAGFYDPSLDKLQPVGSEAYTAQRWLQAFDASATDAVYVVRGADHDAIRETVKSMLGFFPTIEPETVLARIPSPKQSNINLATWPTGTSEMLRQVFLDAGLGQEWSAPTLQFAATMDSLASGNQDAVRPIANMLGTIAGTDSRGAYAVVRIPEAAKNPVPAQGWREGASFIMPVSWVSLSSEVAGVAQRDFVRLGIAMFAAILVLCAVAQRSLGMVSLNVLALLLSAAVFLWLLRLGSTSLSPVSLISLPLLVGLVVDYSLHVLMALEHRQGDLVKTYEQLAAPIVLTGISACIGFGVPALTGQPVLQNLGFVMDLGIMSAVFTCLVLLPCAFPKQSKGDYRDRGFYKFLYRKQGFEWILAGWQLLGRRGSWMMSRLVGMFYAFTHPTTVHAVRDNLAMLDSSKASFGSACRLFMNQAENFSTYGRLSVRPTSDVIDMLGFRQGFEHLQRARDGGKGCLLVTGHLGFFELGGLVMAQLGFPMTALTLPEPSTALTQWRADFRARWGVKTIVVGDHSFSVLDIVRSLNSGAFIASLADRPYDGNSVTVDLPHGKIKFSTGPVLLALLAGCPIVPVGITRQADGLYHIEALGYIEPHWQPEGREYTLDLYTRQVASALVPLFVAYPEQWYHFAPLRCR
jgi:predicted exporter/lauroyl/myristoyl acyltransferase